MNILGVFPKFALSEFALTEDPVYILMGQNFVKLKSVNFKAGAAGAVMARAAAAAAAA